MSYLAKNYSRKKLSFKKGKGSFLYATNGEKYLEKSLEYERTILIRFESSVHGLFDDDFEGRPIVF